MTYPILTRSNHAVYALLHDYVRLYTQFSDDFFKVILEIVAKTHLEVSGQGQVVNVVRGLILYWMNERRFHLWYNIIQIMVSLFDIMECRN